MLVLESRQRLVQRHAGPARIGEDHVHAVVDQPPDTRPRLRGWLHLFAFFGAIAAGAVLVPLASALGYRAGVSVAVYTVTICGLFGISALYHRRRWSPRGWKIMKRLDHSMIFLFIAGYVHTLLAAGRRASPAATGYPAAGCGQAWLDRTLLARDQPATLQDTARVSRAGAGLLLVGGLLVLAGPHVALVVGGMLLASIGAELTFRRGARRDSGVAARYLAGARCPRTGCSTPSPARSGLASERSTRCRSVPPPRVCWPCRSAWSRGRGWGSGRSTAWSVR